MKKQFGFFTLSLFLAFTTFAQERHTVLSITQELHDSTWYVTQQKLWKSEIDKDKKNAEAWYNYYSATRALKNITEDTSARTVYRKLCTTISKDGYAAIPNTFEGNHLMWWDSGNDESARKYLMTAAKIAPNDSRAFDDLMIYYEILRDKPNFDLMCERLYLNSELPGSMMNWGYNVLAELEPNAIVFVQGDNDTYALWLTQSVKKFRSDVTVVNTSLIKMDEYRDRMLKELNYEPFKGKNYDLILHLIKNRGDRPVHVSSSALRPFHDKPEMDSLYLVGLTYLYSDEEIDNVSYIRRNYEKRFLIDYLKEQFTIHPSDKIAENFDALYLPSMIKLYRHYKNSEDLEKMSEIKMLMLKISMKTGQEDMVKELLKDC